MIRAVCIVASVATASAVLPSTAFAAVPTAPLAQSSKTDVQPVPPANHVSKAGLGPQWVQYPYLSGGKKGKLTVVAKVYVDPVRTRARKGCSRTECACGWRWQEEVQQGEEAPFGRSCCPTMRC